MLRKYYVESGPHFLVIIQATDELDAILRAVTLQASKGPLKLADVVIANERGYVWNRPGHELRGDELVVGTRLLLGISE